jgi:hypothetical protein
VRRRSQFRSEAEDTKKQSSGKENENENETETGKRKRNSRSEGMAYHRKTP